MPGRTPLAASLAAICAAAGGCGEAEPAGQAPSAETQARRLAGAPAPLAAVHRQANQLLEGGEAGFRARLRALRGYPVVVNKWASWCGPCRAEFPFFQQEALGRGRRIAFLGVNGSDNDAAAARFLEEFPVSYPSYKDPALKISARVGAIAAFPATAYYDRGGRLAYLHQGGYASRGDLAADIDRYAR